MHDLKNIEFEISLFISSETRTAQSTSAHTATGYCQFQLTILKFLQVAQQILILLYVIFYYHCYMFLPMLIIM